MPYIDKEKFRMHIIRCQHNPLKVILTDKEKEKFTRMLDEVPTADVVEVVQCKDCKHRPYLVPAKYDSSGKCIKYAYITSIDEVCPYVCEDPWYNLVPEDNFFCGFGERKETEDVH